MCFASAAFWSCTVCILNCCFVGDITIVTPYVGQLFKLKAGLKKFKVKTVLDEKDEELLNEFLEGKHHARDIHLS